MLPVGIVLLLTACNETGAHPGAVIAPQPAVERTAATDFDPGDTEQER
jgi:hypothetical protein